MGTLRGGIYFELTDKTEIPWCPLSALLSPMSTNDLPILLSALASLKHCIKNPKCYTQLTLEMLATHASTTHGTVVQKARNHRSPDVD